SRPSIHDLGTLRTGIDVAVDTGLIAEFANIDLDRVDARPSQVDPFLPYPRREGEHCSLHSSLSPCGVSNTCLAHNTLPLRSSLDTPGLSFLWDSARHPENSQRAWPPLAAPGSAAGLG